MYSTHDFNPDWVSAPGDTIADILQERDLPKSEFARLIGQTFEEVEGLLQGRTTITIATARGLERVLGGSVEFWMSRDFQYRQDFAKRNIAEREWLNELPVGDMIRFGWIKPAPHPSEELASCLRFFGVPSVQAWREAYADLQRTSVFRTSPSFDSRPGAVAAWLRQGEIEAEEIYCLAWNPKRLEESLPQIRSLTREKDPSRFLPKLQRICAESGVAVAVVRAPSGCRASGATRFLSPTKALLLLSFRYLTDDHFWFTFFHEVGHLLLHGSKNSLFLEGVDASSTVEEEEANNFSARTLIPCEFYEALLRLRVSSDAVIRFAVRLGISPGIVVGQLQHIGKIKHNQLNSLKRRYTWSD